MHHAYPGYGAKSVWRQSNPCLEKPNPPRHEEGYPLCAKRDIPFDGKGISLLPLGGIGLIQEGGKEKRMRGQTLMCGLARGDNSSRPQAPKAGQSQAIDWRSGYGVEPHLQILFYTSPLLHGPHIPCGCAPANFGRISVIHPCVRLGNNQNNFQEQLCPTGTP